MMNLKEALEKGIERVFCKEWKEGENSYLKLPIREDGKYGPWAQYYSEEFQNLLGIQLLKKY